MRNIRAARRYARAFFEISLERQRVREAYRELQTACARIASVPDAVRILEQPFISNPIKLRACEIVLQGAVSEETIAFVKLLVSRDRGDLMAVAHRRFPVFGVQFHPESILTPDGYRLLANFLRIAGLNVAEPLPTIDDELRPRPASA